ncbi:GGDEF and EAL domain-containing protein [Kaistia defluvii]|uniref:putative bifunctional diguanylate cyclase/phosphodiesterase n=1 Tax=Kaistia defluvii TaxID=410841 RepID=UPI0022599B5E|nr:GGDEF and EAL domain-containing protein [Kaistia defluvii]MCX5518983.1 GGDEF and EAL domain-containing protein [Kaistia defluvii]
MFIGALLLGTITFLLGGLGLFLAPFGMTASIAHLVMTAGLALYAVAVYCLYRNLSRMRCELQLSMAKQQEHSAAHTSDPLTGLLTRAAFMQATEGALARWRDGCPAVFVFLIDLDRFKAVNDTHGHAAGDRVLAEVGKRLAMLTNDTTVVSRLGSDEFAILLHGGIEGASEILEQHLQKWLSSPIDTPQGSIRISASVGLAISERRDLDAEALLRAADMALYREKRIARSKIGAIPAHSDDDVEDHKALQADFQRALDGGEIVPYYQPLIALDGDSLIGFEVLARWAHPARGLIAPTAFIPIAEEMGRIGDLFDRLLVRACHDARAWPSNLRLSVNISPSQFAEPQMASRILDILARENFSPARLELEITENALVDEVSAARLILTTLRRAGISVALDDFGTGYSSLRHLSDLPVDRLKIDREFVERAQMNDEGWRIVRAIMQLATTFDLATTAEGIEAPEILSTLRELGCDIGQGYLFGRPVSAEQTTAWLRRRTAPIALAS